MCIEVGRAGELSQEQRAIDPIEMEGALVYPEIRLQTPF
jgi:hypothetical protein